MEEETSEKEISPVKKKSAVHIMKTYMYDLRKRKQITTKTVVKSFNNRRTTDTNVRKKETNSSTTRQTTKSKVRAGAVKKKRLKIKSGSKSASYNKSFKGTTDQKATSFQVSCSKATLSKDSATVTCDPKPNLSQVPDSKPTAFNDYLIQTPDPKSTSPELPFDILSSSKASQSDGKSAIDDWPMKDVYPKRSIEIKMEPSIDLFGGGMVVLNDGRKLIADHINIMLYSSDMRLLCIQNIAAREVPERTIREVIKDIAVFSETVAIVMLYAGIPKVKFVNISPGSLSLSSTTINLKICSRPNGITSCRGHIYYTTIDNPPSVKKIDSACNMYWSTSTDHEDKNLFCIPSCIESFVHDNSVRLVVADAAGLNNITLLDGDTGDVLFVRQGVNCMSSLTIDPFNNIYICYTSIGLVSVMKSDLSDERIILTTPLFCAAKYSNALKHDLDEYPQQIAFDQRSNSLLITSGPVSFNSRVAVQIYQFP